MAPHTVWFFSILWLSTPLPLHTTSSPSAAGLINGPRWFTIFYDQINQWSTTSQLSLHCKAKTHPTLAVQPPCQLLAHFFSGDGGVKAMLEAAWLTLTMVNCIMAGSFLAIQGTIQGLQS
uniref:Uncharacterized protein n=1 Tax=Eutreptiella gymnastica TaxID=73025 RepID=A0A7S4LG31_9EUGL